MVESREDDEEVKEGKVEREDVVIVYEGYVEDIPEVGDESEGGTEEVAVPDAHRSRIIGARFNMERPSLSKAKSDMTDGDMELSWVSNQTLKGQTTT